MPRNKVQTAKPLADGIQAGTYLRFMVVADEQAASPADPENPTIGERLFVQANLPIEDDGVFAGFETSQYEHVAQSLGLTAQEVSGLKSVLGKIYNHFRTAANLDEA
jgi:hypothetical protein